MKVWKHTIEDGPSYAREVMEFVIPDGSSKVYVEARVDAWDAQAVYLSFPLEEMDKLCAKWSYMRMGKD